EAADNVFLDMTNAITLSAWIKPEKATTQYLIKKAEQGQTNGYELSLSGAGKIFFRFNQSSSADTYRVDSQIDYPVNGDKWMHVAATFDGAVLRIYINGVEDNFKVLNTSASIGVNSLPLFVGGAKDG